VGGYFSGFYLSPDLVNRKLVCWFEYSNILTPWFEYGDQDSLVDKKLGHAIDRSQVQAILSVGCFSGMGL